MWRAAASIPVVERWERSTRCFRAAPTLVRNFELRWALDLHTTIAVNLAGFFTGELLKDTGPADDVAFSSVGITYRF